MARIITSWAYQFIDENINDDNSSSIRPTTWHNSLSSKAVNVGSNTSAHSGGGNNGPFILYSTQCWLSLRLKRIIFLSFRAKLFINNHRYVNSLLLLIAVYYL
jgi:hypothetical protein